MTTEAPKTKTRVVEQEVGGAPKGWAEAQDGLADSTGLSLLLVDGVQPPALAISNNNSICRAIQSSADHVRLCDAYCGDAHRQALKSNAAFQYKCHAGLTCVAMPVKIGKRRDLAVIGGRAFLSSTDYHLLVQRLRSGDLTSLMAAETFENILFSDSYRLDDLVARVTKATAKFQEKPEPLREVSYPATPVITTNRSHKSDLELEVERLRNELEYRTRFAESLQHFLERISSTDPEKTYRSIIVNTQQLLQAERASLFILDHGTNELVLKAAAGLPVQVNAVSRIRPGEGIAGEVLQTGKPLLVEDTERVGLKPAGPERLYLSRSFISYPLSIGGRKIGVLNLTERSGDSNYNRVDLSLLDIIAPQLALALERAEWQERATEFQLMSITDPLTSLPNRRYLEERLTEELNRSRRYDYAMSFLMIDIDDFKTYNDLNGHQAGDLALQITAHCLKAALRSADVASRYGGEEFSILLPQTSASEAAVIAERMCERVAGTNYPHGRSQPRGQVTISIGISSFSGTINTPERIIAVADRALYNAKSKGKNRIEFYQEEPLRQARSDERT
jgi:diguanylate cyclase (GGDEF)-like protein